MDGVACHPAVPGSGISYPLTPKQVIQSVDFDVQFLTLFGDSTLLNALQGELGTLNGGLGEANLNSSLFDTGNSHKK